MIHPYYQDEYCTIYNADCRDVLPQLEPVDLVLTDPPYGIGESVKAHKRAIDGARRPGGAPHYFDKSEWDNERPSNQTIHQVISKGQKAIVWGGNYFALPESPCWLVWDKQNGSTDFADCELAWTNQKGAVRKFTWMWNGMIQQDMKRKETRVHPTQKPVALMKWCIQQAGSVRSVADFYMGSGTTLRAAKDLGLKAIGIEIERKYCDIAIERLRQQAFNFAEAA